MTEPTKFFTQHHPVEPPVVNDHAFRTGWLVKNHLNGLLREHAISFDVWAAGVEYRRLAEIRLAGMFPPRSFDQGTGAGFGRHPAGRIDAGERLVAIKLGLGRDRVVLLNCHLVDDMKWSELGRRLRVHPTTARRRTIAALKVLTEVLLDGGSSAGQNIRRSRSALFRAVC
jgi:hypothetical protein